MKIWSMHNKNEYTQMLGLCKNLWEKRSLVPVIGTGFSLGTPTDNNGHIQSVTELQVVLLEYIVAYSQYDEDDIEDIKRKSLSEIAGCFWDIFNRIPEEKVRDFYSFISTNFQNISFFRDFQTAFLSIDWPCIFTLNYDTLIEDFSK